MRQLLFLSRTSPPPFLFLAPVPVGILLPQDPSRPLCCQLDSALSSPGLILLPFRCHGNRQQWKSTSKWIVWEKDGR